ncbi:hypothetical protein ACFL27_12050 [candidate division CSSED10-310 bacterium]|uniref:ABC-2 type transporter domain-containing protein n=1 Tax=candidate division CSSED10-310 bacterium TaxID=2855610 RepID=A0ABV6YXX1_UNCC1
MMKGFKQYLYYQYYQLRMIFNFIMHWHQFGPWILGIGLGLSLYLTVTVAYEVADFIVSQSRTLDVIHFCLSVKKSLDGLFFFISFVVLVGVVEVLFRGHQMAEKEQLRIFPVSETTLFSMKINDVAVSICLFIFPFVMLPFIIAAPALNLPLTIVILFVVAIFFIVLQIIFGTFSLCLLAVHLFPRHFWRNIIGISMAVGLVFFLLFTVTRYFHSAGFTGLQFLSFRFFPTQLTFRILLDWYTGDPDGVYYSFFLHGCNLLLLGTACYVLYTQLFIRYGERFYNKVRPRRQPDSTVDKFLRKLDSTIVASWRLYWALILKELYSLIRDTSLKIAFFAGLVLSTFPFLPLLLLPGEIAQVAVVVIIIVIFLFCIHFVLFLCLSSTGREGEAIQNISLYPVSIGSFMFAKGVVYFFFLLLTLCAGGYFLSFYLHILSVTNNPVWLIGLFVISMVHSFFMTSMTFCLGCIFPRFNAKNQFRAVSLWAIGLFMSLSLLYLSTASIGIWAPLRFGVKFIYFPFLIYFLWFLILITLYKEATREMKKTLTLFRI